MVLVLPAGGLTGTVSINSYGETRSLDARNLLDMILRINGYALVQEGEEYRVFKMVDAMHQPIPIQMAGKDIPADDQIMLNLIFLKYVTVDELGKVLNEFIGEYAKVITYSPANLLFILDNRRNIVRITDLIAQFDNDTFTNQRVRLFELEHARPSDVQKDLENVLKAISLDAKTTTVHFLAVDRINMLIAVAPNPGVFETIEQWIAKFDIPATVAAGAVDTYVYSVRYGRNDCLAQALNQLFNPAWAGGYGAGGSAMGREIPSAHTATIMAMERADRAHMQELTAAVEEAMAEEWADGRRLRRRWGKLDSMGPPIASTAASAAAAVAAAPAGWAAPPAATGMGRTDSRPSVDIRRKRL